MKRSIFGRIAALLICAVVLLSCVACAGEEGGEAIPSGMQNATAAGADFRLYVPTHWSANTAYGVSGGYYHLVDQSTISMVKYPIPTDAPAKAEGETTVAELRADWFYEHRLLPQIDGMKSGEVTKADQHDVTVLIDGINATQYHVKTKVKGEEMHFLYVIVEKNDAIYVISYTVTSGLYVMLVEDYLKILGAIRFADPYVPKTNAKEIDESVEAPEGMKIASNNDVSYRLFVPKDWTVDRNQTVFAASAKDGKANVSVVPYLPSSTSPMSVMEYFEANRLLMTSTPDNEFEMIG
jgi:hypothetical protein